MEPGEYDALVSRARTGNDSAAVDLLQAMRVHKIRQPELAVLHGGRLLKTSQRKLGNEVWTIFEQVFLAAVEVGADEWRDYCLGQLTKRFPSSIRVERLKGIHQESLKKYAEAKKIYEKILADKPEDTVTQKRMISMLKQTGKTTEAVEHVNNYLKTFSGDSDVWHELAELYIEAGSLQRALYCYEELMLVNPRSLYHVLTHAELLYSTGDFELSRKYYSLAAYLDGSSLRALWGLIAVNAALSEKDKSNEKMEQLNTFTIERLKAAYSGVGAHGKVAVAMLQNGFS